MNATDDYAAELTAQHRRALVEGLLAEEVINGAITAVLNVALEEASYPHVSAWLRKLADTVDMENPSAPGLAN